MNGQWIGRYTGSNNGLIIINIDDIGDHYEGITYLHDDDTKLPGVAAAFKTKDKNRNLKFTTELILPIDPSTGKPDFWENIKKYYEGIWFPKSNVHVESNWNDKLLTLKWTTEFGTTGYCELPKSKASSPSEYVPIRKVNNWNGYKKYVSTLEGRRYLFVAKMNRGDCRQHSIEQVERI